MPWVPDKNVVSQKETVGRRVFEDNPYFERNGQKVCKTSLFYETRPTEDMSFDRLCVREPQINETVEYLTPIASDEAAQRNPPRPFNGWMAIKVKAIENLNIKPDPIAGDPPNPYHAVLPMERFRDGPQADNLACRLAYAVHGQVSPARRVAEPPKLELPQLESDV